MSQGASTLDPIQAMPNPNSYRKGCLFRMGPLCPTRPERPYAPLFRVPLRESQYRPAGDPLGTPLTRTGSPFGSHPVHVCKLLLIYFLFLFSNYGDGLEILRAYLGSKLLVCRKLGLDRMVTVWIPNPLEVQNRGFFLVCLVRASLTHWPNPRNRWTSTRRSTNFFAHKAG